MELEEGPEVDIDVIDETVIAAPGLNIELEDDGGVVVDFDPRAAGPETDDFYDNLAELLDDRASSSISSELMEQYEANKSGRKE